jgi:hypothetical protein
MTTTIVATSAGAGRKTWRNRRNSGNANSWFSDLLTKRETVGNLFSEYNNKQLPTPANRKQRRLLERLRRIRLGDTPGFAPA